MMKNEQCELCGSENLIDYPHMGINCEDCNPKRL